MVNDDVCARTPATRAREVRMTFIVAASGGGVVGVCGKDGKTDNQATYKYLASAENPGRNVCWNKHITTAATKRLAVIGQI